jgi:hypothetical protein
LASLAASDLNRRPFHLLSGFVRNLVDLLSGAPRAFLASAQTVYQRRRDYRHDTLDRFHHFTL